MEAKAKDTVANHRQVDFTLIFAACTLMLLSLFSTSDGVAMTFIVAALLLGFAGFLELLIDGHNHKRNRKQLSQAALGVLFFCCIIFPLFSSVNPVYAETTTTVELTTSTNAGYIYNYNANYNSARDAISGTAILDQTANIGGQNYNGIYYFLYRGYVYFDTSVIPSTATINNATLSIDVFAIYGAAPVWNLTIQSGGSTYPHSTLEAGDYYQAWYTGNGGSANTSGASAGARFNITLSSTGLGWINKGATTKFALRSSNDINSVVPTTQEYLVYYTLLSGEAVSPKLRVTYTMGGTVTPAPGATPPPASADTHYLIHGPYYEDGTNASVLVNASIYQPYAATISNLFNGTDGTADLWNVTLDQPATYLSWNTSSLYNTTRVYYFGDSTYDEIWLYLPSTTEPNYVYTFTVTNLADISNAFLEATINVGGNTRVVERQKLDTLNAVSFYLTQFHKYDMRVVADEGTLAIGSFIAGLEQTQNILIPKDAFPSSAPGHPLTINVARVNSTYIQANYSDANMVTYWVNFDFQRKVGTTYVSSYSTNTTGYTASVNWYAADNETDYQVHVSMNYAGAVYDYVYPAVAVRNDTNPWADLNDFGASAPFPLEYVVGIAITVASGLLVFSVTTISVGCFVSWIAACICTYLHWLPYTAANWTLLAFAGCIVFMIAIVDYKRNEREI